MLWVTESLEITASNTRWAITTELAASDIKTNAAVILMSLQSVFYHYHFHYRDFTNLNHANKSRGLITNHAVCRIFSDVVRVVITTILAVIEISLGIQIFRKSVQRRILGVFLISSIRVNASVDLLRQLFSNFAPVLLEQSQDYFSTSTNFILLGE